MRGHKYVGKKCAGVADVESDMEPAVHVQPDEITTTHGLAIAAIEQAKWKPQPAAFDKIEKSVIEQAVQQSSYPSISHSPHRLEHHIVLGPSPVSYTHLRAHET